MHLTRQVRNTLRIAAVAGLLAAIPHRPGAVADEPAAKKVVLVELFTSQG